MKRTPRHRPFFTDFFFLFFFQSRASTADKKQRNPWETAITDNERLFAIRGRGNMLYLFFYYDSEGKLQQAFFTTLLSDLYIYVHFFILFRSRRSFPPPIRLIDLSYNFARCWIGFLFFFFFWWLIKHFLIKHSIWWQSLMLEFDERTNKVELSSYNIDDK